MQLFDLQVDFFIPLWRRIAVVVICLAWSVFEFVTLAPLWGIVFGATGVYAIWQFFLDGWPSAKEIPPAGKSE
ncbi:MAG: DUF3329 domain-containing protein [Pseudomonadota bacterium]